MALKQVFSPIAIGPVEIPNRVVRTGHGTGLGGGTISDQLIDYHVARARGGVGLTIIELMAVHSSAYPFLTADGAGVLDGYRKLMEQVRPYGMRVFQQLGHLGNEAPQRDGEGQYPLAQRHARQDVVYQIRRRPGHSSCAA